jgi:hypothetical protein
MDEKQRGRTFDEFNLVFYRTCATISSDKIAPKKQYEEKTTGNATN